MGLSYSCAKEIVRIDVFCRLSTMHERDKQTDHGTIISIALVKSFFIDVASQLFDVSLSIHRCQYPRHYQVTAF